jgi:hypothetical protein
MNSANVSTATDNAKRTFEEFLTTLAGLANTWASYGLKIGKLALEQSAEALGKTARTLGALATELDKKAAADAAVGSAGSDADAHKVDVPPSNTAPAT